MLHGTNSGLEAFVKLLEIFQGLALGTELSLVSIEWWTLSNPGQVDSCAGCVIAADSVQEHTNQIHPNPLFPVPVKKTFPIFQVRSSSSTCEWKIAHLSKDVENYPIMKILS